MELDTADITAMNYLLLMSDDPISSRWKWGLQSVTWWSNTN